MHKGSCCIQQQSPIICEQCFSCLELNKLNPVFLFPMILSDLLFFSMYRKYSPPEIISILWNYKMIFEIISSCL